MTSISDLPCEILVHLFKFFYAIDLVDTLSKVCVQWNELIFREKSLWKDLRLLPEEQCLHWTYWQNFERQIPRYLCTCQNCVHRRIEGRRPQQDLEGTPSSHYRHHMYTPPLGTKIRTTPDVLEPILSRTGDGLKIVRLYWKRFGPPPAMTTDWIREQLLPHYHPSVELGLDDRTPLKNLSTLVLSSESVLVWFYLMNTSFVTPSLNELHIHFDGVMDANRTFLHRHLMLEDDRDGKLGLLLLNLAGACPKLKILCLRNYFNLEHVSFTACYNRVCVDQDCRQGFCGRMYRARNKLNNDIKAISELTNLEVLYLWDSWFNIAPIIPYHFENKDIHPLNILKAVLVQAKCNVSVRADFACPEPSRHGSCA